MNIINKEKNREKMFYIAVNLVMPCSLDNGEREDTSGKLWGVGWLH